MAEPRRTSLPILQAPRERHALVARWPDAVMHLDDDDRARRVKSGSETVVLDAGTREARGFVRAVLRVPLGHPEGTVYSVFVEVDRATYQTLQRAFRAQEPVEAWGTLANALPSLEPCAGSRVCVREEGGEKRAQVVDAEHPFLRDGPPIGPA